MQRQELEKLSREELIAHAERLNVPRPRVLTQPELIDEIIARTARTDRERARSRGWLGKARDLLARVIEQGLHLPDAARAVRTSHAAARSWPTPPPPLPTVTLAEIYAAQGHLERAVSVLDEVIAREPDHKEARELRERFAEQTQRTRGRPSRAIDSGRTEARGGAERAEAKAQEPAASKAAANEAVPSEAAANEAIPSEAAAKEAAPNEAASNEVSTPQEARAEQATAQEEAAPATEAVAFAAEDEPSNVEAAEEVKAKSVEIDEETKTSSAETATESAAETATETAAETAADTAAEPPTEASVETSAEVANEAEEPAAERAVGPAPLTEPTREAPAIAAEDDGSGPMTERDEAALPAAEAMPAEPTPNAEHGADAADSAIELDETVVDDQAIADLTERLRAQEETAQQETAQQETAQQPAEEDLPETYDVDEVVAIAVDPETIYVYWEVRAVTLARALARRPSGRLALRIAAVSPSWDGPVTRTWEILVDALHGDRFIHDIPQGANVRVSVGWLDGGSFEPFAVGAEVASPRLAPSEVESREVGHWTPEIHLPASPVPLGRAPRASRTQGTWAPAPHGLDSPAPSQGAGPATSPGASAASPVALNPGRPAPGLTALAPSGGTGPGIDRATRSAELTRSYFRSFAGNYIRSGASDQVRGGASEYVRGGASEYVRGGASDLWGGASDRIRGGASDQLWGGASDLSRTRSF